MPAPSEQDLYDLGRAELLRLRPDLAALPGDIVDLVVWAAVAMAGVGLAKNAQDTASTYVDGAEGDKLRELARDHWSIEPEVDVKAVGTVTFSHTAGPTGSIPAGTRVATDPDENGDFVTAVTDDILVFGAGDASLSIAATAQESGRAGNVDAGEFTRILDPLFDTFTVTNAERFAGGNEDQTDDEIRADIRGFVQNLRRGTKDAIEYGAKESENVRIATAVEDPANGLGTVYVTDSDGNANAQMVNDVIIELENWRALGAVVQVSGGELVSQAISVSLTVRAGVAIAPLVTRVRSAIVAAVNKLRIGDTLDRDLIAAAAKAVDPDAILKVTVNTPAADVAPTASQVIRTSLGLVSVA